jgi:glycine dehydrogenase subunit 1
VKEISYGGAHELTERLLGREGFAEAYPGQPFLNEFTLRYSGNIDALQSYLCQKGFIAGVKAEGKADEMIFAVTEQRSAEEMDRFLCAIAEGVKESINQ